MHPGAGFFPPCSLSAPRASQLNQFQHPCVRDLAWSLQSPPIYRLGQPGNNLLGDPASLGTWLRALDQQPQPLLEAIARQRSHRLGIYFETLIHFTLEQYLKPARLVYALAVRQQGRTLGEYDFLVRKQGEMAMRHIEVSIKFYLGLAQPSGQACWIGLNRKDRLLEKRDKMRLQQLRLSRHPAALQQLQTLGVQVGPCHGLMLGRLFYPFAEPSLSPPPGALSSHLRGWWLRHSEQHKIALSSPCSATRLVMLQRRQWLAPLAPTEAEQLAGKGQENSAIQPGMVARLIKTPQGWRERDRGILVEDTWLDSVFETLE